MTPRASLPSRIPPARRGPVGRGPRVGVVGLGYVGIATGVAFAAHGTRVVGYDVQGARRDQVARGDSPIYEPGLDRLLRRVVRAKRLTVASHMAELVGESDLLFVCVPTPSAPDGSVDLRFVEEAVRDLALVLRKAPGWKAVVVKSTVVPGTTEGLVREVLVRESGREIGPRLGLAANPEFLAEGSLVADALHPSRVVIGCSDRRTARMLREAYRGFPSPVVELSPTAAELVKYASNAFLASRISFANEMAALCEATGTDVDAVMQAVGMDPRLGPRFLRAGPGFGGSCFTKDLRALLAAAGARGVELPLSEAALTVNERQPRHVAELAERLLGDLAGKEVALLGLSFKADTGDVRESRAYPILEELLRRGARVRLHDPRSLDAFLESLPPPLHGRISREILPMRTLREAVEGADLAVIQTDWKEYVRAGPAIWRSLRGPGVLDTRRCLYPRTLRAAGKVYAAVGRPPPALPAAEDPEAGRSPGDLRKPAISR